MSELLEQMKLLNEDHKPDGWPAVRMSEINELIEIIEKKSEQLAKASERVEELEKELATKELLHVGFTNGYQIKYAKEEEGAFYPDTDGDCYIPLYMLKSHEHRIETTSVEQLRKEQEHG